MDLGRLFRFGTPVENLLLLLGGLVILFYRRRRRAAPCTSSRSTLQAFLTISLYDFP